MKIIIAIILIFSFTAVSRAQEGVGRYQIVVAQAAKDWMMPNIVFKIDTATGQTWVYQFGNVEVPEKFRSQFPKGARVDGWTPIPASFGSEVGKVMNDFLGYLREGSIVSPTPARTP